MYSAYTPGMIAAFNFISYSLHLLGKKKQQQPNLFNLCVKIENYKGKNSM